MSYTLALILSAPALRNPARAVLKIDREQVIQVEYRPEPGAAAPFEQAARDGVERLLDIAATHYPNCGFAHTLALCQAIEDLAGLPAPPRAAWLRVAAAELERAASHLETLSAIFATLAFDQPSHAFSEQSASVRTALATLAGATPGLWLLPGGVRHDIADDARLALGAAAARALAVLFPIADRTLTRRALLARTVDVGIISTGAASQFALGGPLARAAGLTADTRRDSPYAAYADLQPDIAPQEGGDVYARILVLLLEALEALKLVERAARDLPAGPWRGSLPETLRAGTGVASVEAPRGPLRYSVESDGRRIVAVSVQVAPQLDRLLARTVLSGATLDDVALIIVSTDPCDTCTVVQQ